jgi:hypothetical protein
MSSEAVIDNVESGARSLHHLNDDQLLDSDLISSGYNSLAYL